MSVTVAEFATQRGMSRQGVYKAIERHNIPTFKGVSNGKSTQFMTDEDAQRLNEILGPTETSNMILKQNLELQIQQDREQLIQEKAEKVEQLLREKEAEMTVTREEMLNRVESGVSEMHKMMDELRAEYRHKEDHNIQLYKEKMTEKNAEIDKLNAIINDLQYENTRLKDRCNQLSDRNTLLQNQLVEAQQHPYRNLKKYWGDKRNGKSTENSSEPSSSDT